MFFLISNQTHQMSTLAHLPLHYTLRLNREAAGKKNCQIHHLKLNVLSIEDFVQLIP